MNRRHVLNSLAGLVVLAAPAHAAEEWTSLSSPPLVPGASRVRIPVENGRVFLSGLKLSVDGRPVKIRRVLLHRGLRSLTVIEVNRTFVPGAAYEPAFPPHAPFLVRAIGVEYEAQPEGDAETVVRLWMRR